MDYLLERIVFFVNALNVFLIFNYFFVQDFLFLRELVGSVPYFPIDVLFEYAYLLFELGDLLVFNLFVFTILFILELSEILFKVKVLIFQFNKFFFLLKQQLILCFQLKLLRQSKTFLFVQLLKYQCIFSLQISQLTQAGVQVLIYVTDKSLFLF